jgi:mRNA interferase HigB
MHVVKRKTLKEYWEKHRQAEGPLTAWCNEAENAKWATPDDIKKKFNSADFRPNNRVVFNIGGNSFRLVVKIMYTPGIVYVRFVGTHAEYAKIDVDTI